VNERAVVMDRAVVGENSLVAAGVPARVIRRLTEAEIAKKLEGIRLCQTLAVRSLKTMRPVEQ
jgi:phenylacetic acid degradation protein